MHHLLEPINQDIKRTQQYIKLNTRAKEIQQVNPGGLTTAKASGPYQLIKDKSFSRNRHRV